MCPFSNNSTHPSTQIAFFFSFTFPFLFIGMHQKYHKSNSGTRHQIYNSPAWHCYTFFFFCVCVCVNLPLHFFSTWADCLPLSLYLPPKSINIHRLSRLLFLAVNHLYIPLDKPFLLVQPPIYHHPCHLACNFIALQLLQGSQNMSDCCARKRERESERRIHFKAPPAANSPPQNASAVLDHTINRR